MANKKEKGFTLVEIIVVLVILAILAAIAIPSVIGYVDEAKQARELTKVRESLIASQVAFVKASAFGDYSKDKTKENDDVTLTQNQLNDLNQYLEEKPYLLMCATGSTSKVGNTDQETSQIYAIIYQKDINSKPWFYDGKKWSHRYLWTKVDQSVSQRTADRPMFANGQSNFMNKDYYGYKEDIQVTMHYVCFKNKLVSKLSEGPDGNTWNTLKKSSE